MGPKLVHLFIAKLFPDSTLPVPVPMIEQESSIFFAYLWILDALISYFPADLFSMIYHG